MATEVSRFAFGPGAPYARRLMVGYAEMFDRGPIADLGSGRGFFLEALRARGLQGIGVDTSDESIALAAELGFTCLQEDAVSYLGHVGGLGGVFASHLIEHMSYEAADGLIRAAASAITPGGRIVLVTPNLADFRTLSETFWLDPTHVRPYPAKLIAQMLMVHGFHVEAVGRGNTPQGRRALPRTMLGRLRFGRDYGITEVWVRARRA